MSTRIIVAAAILAASLTMLAGFVNAAAEVRTIRVPNGGGYPQAAVDAQGRIHLVYVTGEAGSGDAFYVRSGDAGATWTKPLAVNSHPASIVIAGAVRGPQMALGRGGRVHVAWMGSGKAEPRAGKAAPMLYTRLNDAGDAFEPQRNLAAVHPGLDGGGSVAADADGNVYVAWHAPADPESHGEAGRRVWVAHSSDDGKTFAAETAADATPRGVCACCGMSVFAGGKAGVFALYRTADKGLERDVQVLRSTDRSRTFAVAATDAWKIGRCMMSSAGFAAAPSGDVLAAWETAGRIRVARLPAGGERFAEPTPLGEGPNPKHPRVAVNGKGESLVAWTEGTAWAKGGSIAWQLLDADGRPAAGQSGSAKGLPVWGVPAVVAMPDGAFLIVY